MTYRIDRLGHLGDGVAQTPDGPVFATGVLPGEEIEGTLSGDRLSDIRIVTPSTDRVKPPCRHARGCGGCQLQHASDAFVASWKEQVVRTALAGQGLAAPFHPMTVSPAHARRRATLSGRRTKGGALLGFHGKGSDTITAVPDCKLLHPNLIAAFPGLEALVVTGGSRTAELQLMVTTTRGGVDVVVTGGKPLDGDLRLDLSRIIEAHAFSRLTWDGETVALRDRPAQTIGGTVVVPPAGAFLQATAEGEAALLAGVREALGTQRKVVDLFAGVGTFALPLAAGFEVHAVEGDRDMVAALELATRHAQGLRRLTSEARDLFRRPLDAEELKGFSGAVIDPPRAGAEAQTTCLAQSAVPVIAAVSCNPVTFARDARLLVAGGYGLDWVQLVGQFRWSTHIEVVARFSRKG